MASDDRIGQPVGLSSLLLKIAKDAADKKYERGDYTKEQYDEVIEILFPKPVDVDKKADGGIVNLSNGGDALLGQMVEKLKNKPKLASSTQTMGSVIDALNTADDTIVERDTSRIRNIVSGSDVKRQMGPDIFEVFEKGGIKTAQINAIKNVPDINDYLDDFDGYNEAMKKYRNTALKGLNDNQIKLVKSSGFLTEYAEQMRKDILSKGVTKKGNKFVVNPKYKNVITIGKNGIPKISKPKTQSKIYTQIRETAKNTLNKAQQLNLDFALAQIDKLFKTNPTKAKAALAAVASLVSKGAFGATTGGIGFAMDIPMLIQAGKKVKDVALPFVEEEVIEPAAQKMVQGENMLMNLLMNRMN